MPCSISEGEEEFYNKEKYGIPLTDSRLLETVACAALKKLDTLGALDTLPPYCRLWLSRHLEIDKHREDWYMKHPPPYDRNIEFSECQYQKLHERETN